LDIILHAPFFSNVKNIVVLGYKKLRTLREHIYNTYMTPAQRMATAQNHCREIHLLASFKGTLANLLISV
jgi:hypothetical protein